MEIIDHTRTRYPNVQDSDKVNPSQNLFKYNSAKDLILAANSEIKNPNHEYLDGICMKRPVSIASGFPEESSRDIENAILRTDKFISLYISSIRSDLPKDGIEIEKIRFHSIKKSDPHQLILEIRFRTIAGNTEAMQVNYDGNTGNYKVLRI